MAGSSWTVVLCTLITAPSSLEVCPRSPLVDQLPHPAIRMFYSRMLLYLQILAPSFHFPNKLYSKI